jgi:hypothetical protein
MSFEIVKSDRVVDIVAPPASLIERYAHLIAGDPYNFESDTELVPIDDLPDLIGEIERALRPAPPKEVAKAVAVLLGSFKVGNVLQDQAAFTRAMLTELAEFPADVLMAGVVEARRTLNWLPSIAEMITFCGNARSPRKEQLRRANQMLIQHRRRAELAAEREDRARKLEELEAKLPEYFAAAEAELRARDVSPEEIGDKLAALRIFPGIELFRLANAWKARNENAA